MQNQVFKKANGDEVDRSTWDWEFEAIYKDGTTLKQFNEDTSRAAGFFDIDQDKLSELRMKCGEHLFTLGFPKGAKLIHFRRTTVFAANTDFQSKAVQYGFGYEFPEGHERHGEVVLHHLIQHFDKNWLLVSAESKDSIKWVTNEPTQN